MNINERFWKKVNKNGKLILENPCWEWTGATWKGRQGVFYINEDNKSVGAHRYMWEIHNNKKLLKTDFICQICENLSCVNPKHLYLGNQKDAHRNTGRSGKENRMFGKKHTQETKQKMSKSRMGKVGPNATAWKGGHLSVNKRVRKLLHSRYDWYRKVFLRDKWKCTDCGDNNIKLDAHHICPLSKIIKELSKNLSFDNDTEKVEFLIQQKEIIDPNLENGITLCRKCHKNLHDNWGSHYAK